jgi:hypothetical protein
VPATLASVCVDRRSLIRGSRVLEPPSLVARQQAAGAAVIQRTAAAARDAQRCRDVS